MIKAENSPKFSQKPENFRKIPKKNPKNLPPSFARRLGESSIAGQGYFPKFFSGGYFGYTPLHTSALISDYN